MIYLGLFYAAFFGFVGLYSPFLGPYLQSLGYSVGLIAWCLGFMQVTRIFGPFVWGWLADQHHDSTRYIRFASIAAFIVSIVLFLNVHSTIYLLLCMFILNVFISGLVPMADAHALRCYGALAGPYGRVRLLGSLGFMGMVLAFGAAANVWGFAQYPFWAIACLALAAFASGRFGVAQSTLQTTQAALTVPWRQVWQALLGPINMRWFWLASFFMVFAHGVFYGFFSLYLIEMKYPAASIGVFWALGVFFEIIFFAMQGRFFHKVALTHWMLLAYLVCALRFAITAGLGEFTWALVFAQSLHAITFAAHHSAAVLWLQRHVPQTMQMRGQALYTSIAYGLGGTLAALLGQWVWAALGPRWVFVMAAVSAMFALGCGVRLSGFVGKN